MNIAASDAELLRVGWGDLENSAVRIEPLEEKPKKEGKNKAKSAEIAENKEILTKKTLKSPEKQIKGEKFLFDSLFEKPQELTENTKKDSNLFDKTSESNGMTGFESPLFVENEEKTPKSFGIGKKQTKSNESSKKPSKNNNLLFDNLFGIPQKSTEIEKNEAISSENTSKPSEIIEIPPKTENFQFGNLFGKPSKSFEISEEQPRSSEDAQNLTALFENSAEIALKTLQSAQTDQKSAHKSDKNTEKITKNAEKIFSDGDESDGTELAKMRPKLSKRGYWAKPIPFHKNLSGPLSAAPLTAAALRAVHRFEVGNEHGSIRWKRPVDVRGLDLDRVVVIGPKAVEVYPSEEGKPGVVFFSVFDCVQSIFAVLGDFRCFFLLWNFLDLCELLCIC